MWFFEWLAETFGDIASTFTTIAEKARDIWFVGGTLGDWFDTVAGWFRDVSDYFVEADRWAEDLRVQIASFLTWDGIRDRLELYFPFVTWTAGDFLDWFWDLFVEKLSNFLEARLDWVWRVGERVLNKLW